MAIFMLYNIGIVGAKNKDDKSKDLFNRLITMIAT